MEELIRAIALGRGDDLPETVVAMVQSRLRGLSDAERRLLRAASILGESFWPGGIAALIGNGTSPADIIDALAPLVKQELVLKRRDSRFPGEEEYGFRHALLREGAYSLLTDEDRVLGHRLAGRRMEQQGEKDALLMGHG